MASGGNFRGVAGIIVPGCGEIVLRQLDVGRSGVLFEVAAALGPGDRHEVLALREHPCDRQLRRRDLQLLGDLLDLRGELQVRVEVLTGKARPATAKVVLIEILGRGEATR